MNRSLSVLQSLMNLYLHLKSCFLAYFIIAFKFNAVSRSFYALLHAFINHITMFLYAIFPINDLLFKFTFKLMPRDESAGTFLSPHLCYNQQAGNALGIFCLGARYVPRTKPQRIKLECLTFLKIKLF